MREIKFRAWNVRSERHEYFTLLDLVGEDFLCSDDQKKVNLINRLTNWEEFTGFRDKNGKEIYEGDLLRQSNGEVKEVAFKSGIFGKGGDLDFYQIWVDDEIIGNIYEDPETDGQDSLKYTTSTDAPTKSM